MKRDLQTQPLRSDDPHKTQQFEKGYFQSATKADRIINQMKNRIDECWDYWEPVYKMSREDVDFVYKRQWDYQALEDRKNRPNLTMNMIAKYIYHVVGKASASRFAIQISQLSGNNDPVISTKASKYDKSQAMEGLIRDICLLYTSPSPRDS